MRLVVFGAAGRTGQLAVAKALGHGHQVRAFEHTSSLDIESEHVVKVRGDVLDLDTVRAAISGADGVVFTVSSGSGLRAGVHEAGIANVIHAMAENGVSRLAAMSAAGVFDRTSRVLSPAFRLLIGTTLRRTYDDLEAMERRIVASDLAWTIVRPSALSEAPPTGRYKVTLDGSLVPHAGRISRGDVAAVLVKALETDAYRRRTVVVAG
jgi:putative NADH-flavin reductase